MQLRGVISLSLVGLPPVHSLTHTASLGEVGDRKIEEESHVQKNDQNGGSFGTGNVIIAQTLFTSSQQLSLPALSLTSLARSLSFSPSL